MTELSLRRFCTPAVLAVWTSLTAWCNAGTNPVWSFKGVQAGAGTLKGALATDAGAVVKVVPFQLPLPDRTNAETAANQLKRVLDGTTGIREHWDFAVVKDGATYRVAGTPIGAAQVWGKAPFKMPIGVKNLEIATAVDPTIGTARFDVVGAASGADRGEVTVGVAGVRVTVATYSGGADKPLAQLRSEIVIALRTAGLPQAYLDSASGMITVPGVSTGDPVASGGVDEGAVLLTTDSDVAGTAEIVLPCAADYNRDGLVDFVDYLEFLNLYDAQDPGADLNLDGLVDFADFLEFLTTYDQGCPEA